MDISVLLYGLLKADTVGFLRDPVTLLLYYKGIIKLLFNTRHIFVTPVAWCLLLSEQ